MSEDERIRNCGNFTPNGFKGCEDVLELAEEDVE
jgi:hypothetical protein